jgi:hypothetical protein
MKNRYPSYCSVTLTEVGTIRLGVCDSIDVTTHIVCNWSTWSLNSVSFQVKTRIV